MLRHLVHCCKVQEGVGNERSRPHACNRNTKRGSIHSTEASAYLCIWSVGRLIRQNHYVTCTFHHNYGEKTHLLWNTDVRLRTKCPQLSSDGQSSIQRVLQQMRKYFPNEMGVDRHPSVGANAPFPIVLRTNKVLIRDMLFANDSYETDGF